MGVDFVCSQAVDFLSANPDWESLPATPESEPSPEFEAVLGRHLDSVLSIPSFGNFPLSVLARVLTHRERILSDGHLRHHFVISEFERFGADASVLLPAIGIRFLSADNALALLEHPEFAAASPLLGLAAEFRMQANDLKAEIAAMAQFVGDLLERIGALEESNRKILAALPGAGGKSG